MGHSLGVLPLGTRNARDDVVLQHATGPVLAPPGALLRFDASGAGTPVPSCLVGPSAMTLDSGAGILYVTEVGGRVVRVPLAP